MERRSCWAGKRERTKTMISELGHFALIMAMAVAFVQAYAGLAGPWRHNEGLDRKSGV